MKNDHNCECSVCAERYAQLRAPAQASVTADPVREAFRNADAQDWIHLFSLLGYGGHGRFWRSVFEEVQAALAAHPHSSAEIGGETDLVTRLFEKADMSIGSLKDILEEAANCVGAQAMRLGACDAEIKRLRDVPQEAIKRVEGATDIIDEAACLIWAELCPGMVMRDEDRPYYEHAAKAVLALTRPK